MALASQGLSWTQREGKITVQTEASLPPDTRRAVAVTRSDRFVRSAVARHPNSQWAPYAYLMMGVDSTREGDWIAADAKFRQILRQFPNTPLTVETNYNLGLTQLALRKPKEALSYFYDVVDMAPGHPLQAPAYLRAGKTELESGNVEGALRPLIRAASIASEPPSAGPGGCFLGNGVFDGQQPSRRQHSIDGVPQCFETPQNTQGG